MPTKSKEQTFRVVYRVEINIHKALIDSHGCATHVMGPMGKTWGCTDLATAEKQYTSGVIAIDKASKTR